MPDLYDRALGAYLGLAVGDALGATVEFMTQREIALTYRRHVTIIGGGWLRLAPGSVTDDTEMALCIGRAILEVQAWDVVRVCEQFANWLKRGPVDVGHTCRRGIRRYMLDGSLSGPPCEGDAGNGAAMRNLPLVLATLHDGDAFRQQTLEQTHLTHHHPLSDAGTLALGEMTRVLLLGGDAAGCRPAVDALLAAQPKFRFDPYPGRASGYIVDTLQTVLHQFFNTQSFEALLVATVNCGEDADTTGAIAGMLGGALYGADAIPRRWSAKLDAQVVAEIRLQVDGLLRLAGA